VKKIVVVNDLLLLFEEPDIIQNEGRRRLVLSYPHREMPPSPHRIGKQKQISKAIHAGTPSVTGSTPTASNHEINQIDGEKSIVVNDAAQNTDLENGPVQNIDAGKEATVTDPNIVDWDGPDDPENPLNWSTKRKVGATCSIALITFLTYARFSPVF
jgi:hypothetical protein